MCIMPKEHLQTYQINIDSNRGKNKWPKAVKEKFTKEHTQMAIIHVGLPFTSREGNMNLNHKKIYS